MAGVSLNPETFVEGGLLDDADVEFKSAAFELWDYQGKSPVSAPALKLGMELEGGDTFEQYYSMGNANDWMPSEDGKSLMAVGSATGIRKSTNGSMFLSSLVNAGFPASKLGDDISVIVGTKAHMIQKAQPKRAGIEGGDKRKGADGKEYDRTLLVVESIKELPKGVGKLAAGAGAGKGKAAAGKGKAAADAGEAEGGGAEDVAVSAVLQLLSDSPVLEKTKLPAEVFKIVKGSPDQAAVLKLVFSDDFLGADGRPWNYSDGVVSAA